MPIDRTLVVKGPALVKQASSYFYSEKDIDISLESDTEKIETSMHGPLDEVILGRKAKVSFNPTEMTETLLGLMYPYFSTLVGASILTATDVPLEIWSAAGKKITFAAAALTKMPSLKLATKGNPLGAVEYTCVGKNNTAWSDAASLCTVTTAAFTDPATFALSSRLNQVYTGSWAAAGAWAAFTTKEGFDFEFDLQTEELEADETGIFDIVFKSLEVRAKCIPFPGGASPIAEAELLAAMGWQGTGAARGKSLHSMSATHDLVVVGNAAAAQTPKQLLTATISKAAMKTAGMKFGQTALRAGEVGWVATRTFSAGSVAPLASLVLS